MKLEMQRHLRLEQQMKLAPRMIQSMEILQLPILALQERIEQELNDNPVLEIEEPSGGEQVNQTTEGPSLDMSEKDLVVNTDNNKVEDFQRLDSIGDEYQDYMSQTRSFHPRSQNEEDDSKLQAIKNTAARPQSLHEYLMDQWRLVDAEESVKKAGEAIIDYIDARGYLSVRLEQLHNKDKKDFTYEDLQKAIIFVQKLEPTGTGARDLKECLLIQMEQSPDDMSFEKQLVAEYMDQLLENHLPEIAKKLNCNIDKINHAIERMSKLDTSPGLQVGMPQNHAVTADVIVEETEDGYQVRLADYSLPALKVNNYYEKMSRSREVSDKTKEFLKKNIRSAQWIIEAIEQRKSTLLKVARSVVKFQTDFFDKGQLYLKPLPMSKVADEVGVHLATVSRAVAGKYIQCSRGILPLRKFFSGGTEDINGNAKSWEAIRGKLQQIIDKEDKSKPLSDDQIRKKLGEAGIENIARRTVAKYRKLLNIPAARFRKKY
ncbi:MAG: RNA polymerase factor sigma-54 [Planctomycetota bacterium]|jgi:RNA polymerase sigma-54 factor